MELIFITGSSGVGKSTLVPLLTNSLPSEFEVHDFDEKLTKEVAMNTSLLNKWRIETTQYWIEKAEVNSRSGKTTIIVGLVYPQEAWALKNVIPMKFYMLDASEDIIKERLMGKRFSTPDRIEGLKNATGLTPDEFLEENKLLMDKLRLETLALNGSLIDTTNDTPEKTAQKLVRIILS